MTESLRISPPDKYHFSFRLTSARNHKTTREGFSSCSTSVFGIAQTELQAKLELGVRWVTWCRWFFGPSWRSKRHDKKLMNLQKHLQNTTNIFSGACPLAGFMQSLARIAHTPCLFHPAHKLLCFSCTKFAAAREGGEDIPGDKASPAAWGCSPARQLVQPRLSGGVNRSSKH